MKLLKKQIPIYFGSLFLTGSAFAQSYLVDFESTESLDLLNYTENAAGSSEIASSGGINDSGFLIGSSGAESQFVVVSKGAYEASTDGEFTLTQSVFFKTTATLGEGVPAEDLGGAGQDIVLFGLTDQEVQNASDPTLINTFADTYIANALRVFNADDGAGGITVGFRGYTTNDGAANWFGPPTEITIQPDSWYHFSVSYSYTLTDQWVFNYILSEASSDGTVGTVIWDLTLLGAIRPNQFGENPSIRGFFASDTQVSSGVEGFDNLTIVGTEDLGPMTNFFIGFEDSAVFDTSLIYTENALDSSMVEASGGIDDSAMLAGSAGADSQFIIVSENAVGLNTESEFMLSQSVYFKTTEILGEGIPAEDLNGSGQDIIIFGITDESMQSPADPTLINTFADTYIANALRVFNADDGAGGITVGFRGYTTNDGAANWFGPPTELTLQPDSWYYFYVSYSYTLTDQWVFNYILSESSSDGSVGEVIWDLTLLGAIRPNQFGENPSIHGFFASDTQVSSSVKGFDNLTLVGTETASPNLWYGYDILESNWVDTGSWMGWVNVSFDPWVWAEGLAKYVWVGNDSGWAYIPK